jgi:hypothetical protein
MEGSDHESLDYVSEEIKFDLRFSHPNYKPFVASHETANPCSMQRCKISGSRLQLKVNLQDLSGPSNPYSLEAM